MTHLETKVGNTVTSIMSISIYFIKLGLLTFGAYLILISYDGELISSLIQSVLSLLVNFGLKSALTEQPCQVVFNFHLLD